MEYLAIARLPFMAASRYRFGSTDRIQIDGLNYVSRSSDQFGHVFARFGDDADLTVSMDHAEIELRLKAGNLTVYRNWYDGRKAKQRLRSAMTLLSDLPAKEQQTILWRVEFCERFLRAEAAEPKAVSRSDEAMLPVIARIQDELLRIAAARQGKPRRCGRKMEHFAPPSPRTLRRWLTAFVASARDPISVRPGSHRSGNRVPRIDGDSREFALQHAWNCASLNRPSKALVYANYGDALVEENLAREQEGKPPLEKMGRRSFEVMIGKFSPFALYAGRYGKAAALQRFALVNSGLDVARCLERVEMDEYNVSLQTILVELGLWSRLSAKLKATIERTRTWLTVAIDCSTRCILAMRLLEAPPSAESAISALEMAIYDKGTLTDAVGVGSSWEMHGQIESLVTDGGAAFIAVATQVVIRDLGITHEVAPAGVPFLRGTVERFFLTVQSRLLPLFPGQTFENAISKGDYDSEGNACLNIEELNRILIRYAVDIYHNTPHEGLGGETPRNAWRRLRGLYGVLTPPEEAVRRHVFGIATSKRIGNRGIQFLGLHYQSPELQKMRIFVGQKPVAIRINRHDLAAISVRQGSGWISVPCVFREIAGTSIWEWTAAAQDLRRRNADMAALETDTVRQAMADIRQTAAMATKRAEIGEPVMTLADLEKAERELFRSFDFAERPTPADDELLGIGETAAPVDQLQELAKTDAPDSEFGGPDDWMLED